MLMSFHRTLFMTLLVDDRQPPVSHDAKPRKSGLRKDMEPVCSDSMAADLQPARAKTLSTMLTVREPRITPDGVLDI